MVQWRGLTAAWAGAQTADVKESLRITAPGWYVMAFDVSGGVDAMAIGDRPFVASAGGGAASTMSQIYLGSDNPAEPTGAGVLAAIICDGPLVQDPERLAEWRAAARRIMAAAEV